MPIFLARLYKDKEVQVMATSSILENIKIDNPKFIEQYVDAMDASTSASKFQKRTKTKIVVADAVESKRLSELRQKRRDMYKISHIL